MAHSQFDPSAVTAHIVAWLQSYLKESGMHGWVVGVSGGIDSACHVDVVCVDRCAHHVRGNAHPSSARSSESCG